MNRTLSDANYGTHMTPLLTAVLNTTGPVLEFGCGDYSTPILNAVCKAQNRPLITTDTDRVWLNLFKDLELKNGQGEFSHTFKYIKVFDNDWDTNPKPEMWDSVGSEYPRYGVVFIDHRPGERRKVDIYRMKDNAEIIVVHDTETKSYDYESVFGFFKYRYDYIRYSTYTTVLSNTIDVRKLF